jgi:Undecaprenyl-phosphate glucose phosphotransferase
MILTFFLGEQLFSRLILFYAWAASVVFVFLGRQVVHIIESLMIKKGIGVENILIVGVSGAGRQFLEGVRQSGWPGYRVIGFLDAPFKEASEKSEPGSPIINGKKGYVAQVPYLGDVESLPSVLDHNVVDEVIVGLHGQDEEHIAALIEECDTHRLRYRFLPQMLSLVPSFTVTDTLNGVPILGMRETQLAGVWLVVKRFFDIMVSACALLVLSPLLLIIAVGVAFSSPGPIIYTQERIGKDGATFKVYKFRSMQHNAEQATGKRWTVENDKRRTVFGAFLRRTNFDELPQLINVLKGEMSIIGPRPEQPQFVEEFKKQIPRYMQRHRVQVGLTGWAQVNGWRGNTSIAERVQYDLFYIENWSPWLDIRILAQTVIAFFKAQGAY